ncbi:MAG: hypothetical protein WD846_04060 [Patescibacteria group bacterium]
MRDIKRGGANPGHDGDLPEGSSGFDGRDDHVDYLDWTDNEPGQPRTTLFVGGRSHVDPDRRYLTVSDIDGDQSKLDQGARDVLEAFGLLRDS